MEENDTLEDIVPNIKVTTPFDNKDEQKIESKTSTSIESSPVTPNLDAEVEVFDRIANKLLRSGLLLTALELHAELIERGKELSRLREFFDNPHNFEKHIESTSINKQESGGLFPKTALRSPSEQTFDSLDFTHYSDEDIERHGDERIAVLEFELRKAQQTINSLRASLTMSTTGQIYPETDSEIQSKGLNTDSSKFVLNSVPEVNSMFDHCSVRDFYYRGSADGDSCPGEDDKMSKSVADSVAMFESNHDTGGTKYSLANSIKPHERRAINYLINEYLMANNYKLTSITFCDENTEQDFDQWDDVGLNTDRPPDLLRLYRYFWHNCASLLQRSNSNATTVVSAGTTRSTLQAHAHEKPPDESRS